MPCKEEKDKRSAVKNLFWARLQILRRSAPQNDKLLNCSQTPQQTGISNWRQRGKDGGKRCSGRPQLAEINTGVQPCEPKPRPAEARKTRPAGFGTRTSAAPLSKPGGRELKTPNDKSNRKRTMVFRNPPAPLRCQRTAESTNHADKSRSPCHSGCEVAFAKVKVRGEK